MVFALVIIPNIPDNNLCKGVLITVDRDGSGILSSENIVEILNSNGIDPNGKNIDSVSCSQIEMSS